MLAAFVGLVLGVLIAVPPTGIVPLIVLSHALNHKSRRGLAFAGGASLGDQLWVWLGTLGYGLLLARVPALAVTVDFVGAVILVGIAIYLLRTEVDEINLGRHMVDNRFGDFAAGFAFSALDPTRLLTWTITASVASVFLGPLPLARVPPYAIGVLVGKFVWYAALLAIWRRWGNEVTAALRARLLGATAFGGIGVAVWLAVRGVETIVRR